MLRGAALQARFHFFFQVANDELGHGQRLERIMVIS